jgi:tetratricopeptide (TPR) repeat protein
MQIYLSNIFISVLLAISYSAVFASEKPEDVTEAEWAMLPRYCPHTMGYKGHVQPHIGKWTALMGEGFFHMHHHCWALIDFHRSQRAGASASERLYLQQRASGGFRYVIKNVPDNFVLLPEILTWYGRSETLLGNAKNAARAFNQAIEIKPDYWPAYYHFAEMHLRSGKKKEAFEIVKRGLSHSPNAKPLLLLFRELGGKPNDLPKPVEKLEEQPTEFPDSPATETAKESFDKSETKKPREPGAD